MENDWSSLKHPTKDIQGTDSTILQKKTICLCLTGSVAVVNAPHVARNLMRHGAEVICVMSKEATDLIQPELLEWSTGNKVILDITGQIEHITIAGEREHSKGLADMVIVYPASANTIGKIVHGISDTPVTAISMVALGSKTPLVVVPAMHDSMFRNPIVQSNIKSLKSHEIHVLGPRLEENKAKVAEPDYVASFVLQFFKKKSVTRDLQGKTFLITAGPSQEWIDDVRFLSNPSTGKMGLSLTEAILLRGGLVCLLLGPTNQPIPTHPNLKIYRPISTKDFVDQMSIELQNNTYDVLISAAALADFTPINKKDFKISSDNNKTLSLELISTPKLIKVARMLSKDLYIVGFKAESTSNKDELIENAQKRLLSSGINLIVANQVLPTLKDRGFGSDTNEVYVIDSNKKITHIELDSKTHIAQQIIDCVAAKILK